MQILNFKIERVKKPDSNSGEIQVSYALKYLEQDFNYSGIAEIRTEVSKLIAENIYEEIKGQMLISPQFEALMNEIRLLVSKRFLN